MEECNGRETTRTQPEEDDREVSHLNDLVFLRFVDLSCQTAARDGIVDNELVGFEAWLFI